MATLNVGGLNPFGKKYKTLEEAISHAMTNDTIKIHKKQLVMNQGSVIDKSLYIEGNGCQITIPDKQTGFLVKNGSLHLSNATFNLGMQNNGIIFDSKYFGKSYFDHVNFGHKKVHLRELFPSIIANNPKEGMSGIELEFNDCTIDYPNLNARSVILNNCRIGMFYKNTAVINSDDLKIANLAITNTYVISQMPVTINNLTTNGQLTFSGKFMFDSLNVKFSGIFNGKKEVFGKKGEKLIREAVSEHKNQEIDTVINLGDKSELTVNNFNLLNPDDANFYQKRWFNLNGATLNLNNSTIAKLDLPSVANKATISMNNTTDYSDWQIQDVTLSNKSSQSQLFSKQVVTKENLKTQKMDNGQTFGALAELNSMIGLSDVKTQIKAMVDSAKVASYMINERGMDPKSVKSLHMVFAGNPGTGKTAVARLVGKALYENGVLKTSKFTEVQGGDLVAGYVGQTAEKTRKVVEKALDGVLFIDEAYTLTHTEGNNFNDEAVAELLKDMDDHRDRIVVIIAGYTPNMRNFFAKSNPGLKSRFANWVEFKDYTPREMLEIMMFQLNKAKLKLADVDTANTLRTQMLDMIGHLDINSGNGRFVRNVIEKLSSAKDMRIAGMSQEKVSQLSNDDLLTITKQDVINGMQQVRKQQQNMNGLQGMGQ